MTSTKSPDAGNNNKDSHQLNPPSPSEPHPTGREGWLNVKQTIVDCRRSTDRSWRQMWTKIRSGQVTFCRDRNASSNSGGGVGGGSNGGSGGGGGGGNNSSGDSNDMTLDLRGCTVEVAIYYTKRKNVLRLATSNGLCEYLLQCEDGNDMVLWLDSFQQVCFDGRVFVPAVDR